MTGEIIPDIGWPGVCHIGGMTERKSGAEMLGEFFREAAVLTAVFIPLDRVLIGEPLTVWSGFAILGLSGGSLAVGIALERRRKS